MTGASSTSSTSAFSAPARKTVGRYEVVREIGQGGMATVYLARHLDLNRLVALKELGALRASEQSFVKRFLREAQLAGSLSHANIVMVYDYFEDGGAPYIAMEYVERGSLRPYVGLMSPAQIGGVLRDVLAGLDAAEQHHIVHRDLKPENLMVTADGHIKVADFGIAKATNDLTTGAFMTTTGVAVGTPNYISPEQARAQEVGPWTDLYALGMMSFEFWIGRPPFADTQEAMAVLLRQVNDKVPFVSDLDPSVDRRISRWIERLVSKEPRDRPQSAADAWEELEGILDSALGPQWARESQLLEPGELPPAAARPEPARAVAFSQESTSPPSPSERLTPPLEDLASARTLPPTPRRPPVDQAGEPTRVKRPAKKPWRRVVIAAFALVAVAAAVAAAVAPQGASTGAQPAEQAGAGAGVAPATGTTTLDTLSSSPQPSASLTKKTSATQSRTALALARSYGKTADRIEALDRGSRANARLVAALRETASAYRAASTAAARGDANGYAVATTAAAAGRQAVEDVLARKGAGSSPGAAGTGSPPAGDNGVGDSRSDDPSDDEPDN